MPGSYFQFDASSAAEALAMAEQLEAESRYRYFRGQRDAGWSLTSSFSRLDSAARLVAQQAGVSFYAWAAESPELVPYLADEDKVLATIQHHQIAATTLIDFTTSPAVALWFAMDGAVAGSEGVIYLAHPDEVDDVFQTMSRNGPVIRFLHVDVPNLWRLEAQRGLFLETQFDVDGLWPFDRIVFPHGGEEPPFDRRLIYPDRRSQLELAIDGYLERRTREDRMLTFIRETPGAWHVQLDQPEVLPALDPSSLPGGWALGPHEPWSEVDILSPPPTLSAAELACGGDELTHVIAARRRATDLLLVDRASDVRQEMQAAVDRLWEGMRPYPYGAGQIAQALSKTVRYLDAFDGAYLNSLSGLFQVALKLLEDPLEIEIGMAVGSTRAFVASGSLWSCLTSAAKKELGLERPPMGGELISALMNRYGATLDLFDAPALVSLFVSEIVPWQIAGSRPTVCFSPTNMERLGIP